LLLIVGAVLLLMGGMMLVLLVGIVIDVLRNPGDVALIALAMQGMQQSGVAVAGNLGAVDFSLHIDEPLRTLLLLVVCVWVLGALASILKSVVMTGKNLVDRSRGGGE
jgi:hypothetical protein